MKRFFSFGLVGVVCNFLGLNGNARLDNLMEYDKHECAEILQNAEFSNLWDCFLKGQTDLFFDHEIKLHLSTDCWVNAKKVLEIGSGNGYFIHKLSKVFHDKSYAGIEKDCELVKQSKNEFDRKGLKFRTADAEIKIEEYNNNFDIILFRLTLQHLNNPKLALEHAHGYLKEDGYVIIIEAYDPCRIGSHEISSVQEATSQLKVQNQLHNKGNRQISLEILEEVQQQNSVLGNLFEVYRTSLDTQGNRLETGIRFESSEDRKRLFNHGLLFLNILNRRCGIPIDFEKAYEELEVFLTDESSWLSPGAHYLILKKK